jgi:hypothetical protein
MAASNSPSTMESLFLASDEPEARSRHPKAGAVGCSRTTCGEGLDTGPTVIPAISELGISGRPAAGFGGVG